MTEAIPAKTATRQDSQPQQPASALGSILADMPASGAIIDSVLAIWPGHAAYLTKSFGARSPAQLAATETAAEAVLKLAGHDLPRFAAGYQWTCDRLREEEIFFHREGRYRLSTFAEAMTEVYSRPEYMAPYVDGLLFSQVLWFNHIATFEMFLGRVLAAADRPFDYLEIGPGHGLMASLAAAAPLARRVAAWDVSAVSLKETRAALMALDVTRPVELVEVDILKATPPAEGFDLIVISEVLEHLEQPAAALTFLRRALRPEGRIFINVPLNSPSPDHIFLFETPEAVTSLVESAGFRVEAMELYATQGRRIDSALANRISVSAGILAVPA